LSDKPANKKYFSNLSLGVPAELKVPEDYKELQSKIKNLGIPGTNASSEQTSGIFQKEAVEEAPVTKGYGDIALPTNISNWAKTIINRAGIQRVHDLNVKPHVSY
jgi:hypothetical protein